LVPLFCQAKFVLASGGMMSSSTTWISISRFVVTLRAVFGPSSHQPLKYLPPEVCVKLSHDP